MRTKEKTFYPHSIRDKCIRETKWSAFVTWKGVDLQEFGETRRNAYYFLLKRHAKFFGITEDKIPELMKRCGFY